MRARPKGKGWRPGTSSTRPRGSRAQRPSTASSSDETTYRATRHAVDYRDTAPVEAKGKSEPIPVWEAIEARARFGVEVAHHVAGDLVGRDRELTALRARLRSCRAGASSSQLVTLVGVPGIGKSRLLYELSRLVDATPISSTWRQGRCLAYGDGITFWALGEIVKAQAGHRRAATRDRGRREAAPGGDGDRRRRGDADWVYARLRPLVGLDDESELGGDRGGEAFAAWRRFFEELAEPNVRSSSSSRISSGQTTGLLDFVDELVDWVSRRAAPRRLHRPSGAARSAGRTGAAASSMPRPSRSSPLSDTDTRTPDEHAPRAGSAVSRGPANPARPSGRQPPLCGAIRTAVRRARLCR